MNFGEYEPLKEPLLGSGSFGKVIRVKRKEGSRVGQILACKVIRITDGQVSTTIDAEFEKIQKLRHDNIVPVVDLQASVFEDKPKLVLLYMEYCEGGNLEELIKYMKDNGKDISESFALGVAQQMAAALEYCHKGEGDRKGILHRDIKPGNVLLTTDYKVKLCDFGLSAVMEEGMANDPSGSTLAYMAPEIKIDKSVKPWTAKCDVFSLGCTLYQLATYERPYKIQMKRKGDEPDEDNLDEFSEGFRKLVLGCILFNADSRPVMSKVLQEAKDLQSPTSPETDASLPPLPIPRPPSEKRFGDKAKAPLHWAAANNDRDMVQVLLDIGIPVDDRVEEKTALWWALEAGSKSAADLLLENGATYDTDGTGGLESLIQVIGLPGYDNIWETLVGLGAKINVSDKNGISPLSVAVMRRHEGAVRFLFDHNADPNLGDANGRTPLHIASDATTVVENVIGSDLKLTSKEISVSTRKILELLIDHEAQVNAQDGEGSTPIHKAAASGCLEGVETLLKKDRVDLDLLDSANSTALHVAIDEPVRELASTVRIVDLLLTSGVKINWREDTTHITALHKAVDKGFEETVARLIKDQNLDVDAADQEKRTALHIAAGRGFKKAVYLLLTRSEGPLASIFTVNARGRTALHEALKRAARITKTNRRDIDLVTLLMSDNPEHARRILAIQDEDGNTPLHLAVNYRATLDLVRDLVEFYPEAACIPNKQGKLPYECRIGPDTDGSRDFLRYVYVQNSGRSVFRSLGSANDGDGGKDHRIFFDLSCMTNPVSQEFLDSLSRHMSLEPVLEYVALSTPCLKRTLDESHNKQNTFPPAVMIFEWLRHKMSVKRVLEVRVEDDVNSPHTDRDIERALEGLQVEVWDWRKLDIPAKTILRAAPQVKVLHLYTRGNHGVLYSWSSKDGLIQLKDSLKRINLRVSLVNGLGEDEAVKIQVEEFRDLLKKKLPAVHIDRSIDDAVMYLAGPTSESRSFRRHGWLDSMYKFSVRCRNYDDGGRRDDVFNSKMVNWRPKLASILDDDAVRSVQKKKEMVRVAVLDEGVDVTLPWGKQIAEGRSFVSGPERGRGMVDEYFVWENGHGNLTSGLIGLFCPPENLELYVAKVVSANNSGTSLFNLGAVTKALKWCIRKQVHIICMNWAIQRIPRGQQREVDDFIAAIREVHKADIIMFCPGKRNHQATEDTGKSYDAEYYNTVYDELDDDAVFNTKVAMPLPTSLSEVVRIDAARLGEGLQSISDMGFVDFTFPGDRVLAEMLLDERDICGGKQYAEQLLAEFSPQDESYNDNSLGQAIATGLAAGTAALIMHLAGIIQENYTRQQNSGLLLKLPVRQEKNENVDALTYAQTQAGMRRLLGNYCRNWKVTGYRGFDSRRISHSDLVRCIERLLYTT